MNDFKQCDNCGRIRNLPKLSENNKDIVLNWSEVPESEGYLIWHGNNVSEVLDMNEQSVNIESADVIIADETITSWIDHVVW